MARVKPVKGAVSQKFGVKNSAYRLGYHPGTDYIASTGTQAVAATSGKAYYYRGNNGGYGNVGVIILRNGDVLWYSHLKDTLVKNGTTVKTGQKVFVTNNTGWSTGPHLHIEVRKGGSQNRPVDFEKWVKGGKTVTVTGPANVRKRPSTSAPLSGSKRLKKGDKFTSVGLVKGTNVNGNNKWHKTSKGNFVWSGNTNVKR